MSIGTHAMRTAYTFTGMYMYVPWWVHMHVIYRNKQIQKVLVGIAEAYENICLVVHVYSASPLESRPAKS